VRPVVKRVAGQGAVSNNAHIRGYRRKLFDKHFFGGYRAVYHSGCINGVDNDILGVYRAGGDRLSKPIIKERDRQQAGRDKAAMERISAGISVELASRKRRAG
jgi:hypothetical protein